MQIGALGSERLLRQAKGKLKQSGGLRSTENGEQPYCDFLTIVETAKMRGIDPYRAVHATFAGEGGLLAKRTAAANALHPIPPPSRKEARPRA